MSEEKKAGQTITTKEKSKNLGQQFLIWTVIILCLPVAIYYIIGSENYSNGERIGLVTQFSKRGVMFKSWEGHLNITQTGMNSADGFDFSLDRTSGLTKNSEKLLDSSATYGWKVKLIYHQTFLRNWFSHRGETNYFIDSVIVLDKSFSSNVNNGLSAGNSGNSGRVVDTVYIVITPSDPNYEKFFKK
jgi:hypothetical protein